MKESKRLKLRRGIASAMMVILVFTQFPLDGVRRAYATGDEPIDPPDPSVVSVSLNNDSDDTIYIGSVSKNTVSLNAVVEMSDGSSYMGDINWDSDKTNVATVENGKVTAGYESGIANITAAAGGVSASYAIKVDNLEVVDIHLPSAVDVILGEYGKSVSLSYELNDSSTINYSDSNLGVEDPIWSSDNTGIVNIDNNGWLTINDYGNTVVNVTVNTSNRGQLTKSCPVSVSTNVTEMALVSPSANVISYLKDNKVEFSVEISGEINEAEKEKIKWQSDNEDVISFNSDEADNTGLDAKGVLVQPGDVTITAELGTTGRMVSQEFHVKPPLDSFSISINYAIDRFYNGDTNISDDFFIVNLPEGLSANDVYSNVTYTAESPDANVRSGGCNVTAHFTCNEPYDIEDYTIPHFIIKPAEITMTGVTITGEKEYKKNDLSLPADVDITYSFDGVVDADIGKVFGKGIEYKLENDSVSNNAPIKRVSTSSKFYLDGEVSGNYTCSFNKAVSIPQGLT